MKIEMKEMVYTPYKHRPELLLKGFYKGYKFAIFSIGQYPIAFVESKFPNLTTLDDERLWLVDFHWGADYLDTAFWSRFDNDTQYIGFSYGQIDDFSGQYLQKGMEEIMPLNTKKWTISELFNDVKRIIAKLKEVIRDLKEHEVM